MHLVPLRWGGGGTLFCWAGTFCLPQGILSWRGWKRYFYESTQMAPHSNQETRNKTKTGIQQKRVMLQKWQMPSDYSWNDATGQWSLSLQTTVHRSCVKWAFNHRYVFKLDQIASPRSRKSDWLKVADVSIFKHAYGLNNVSIKKCIHVFETLSYTEMLH